MNGHTDRDCGPVCDGLDADGYGCLCDCHDTGPTHTHYDPPSMEHNPDPCPACVAELGRVRSAAAEIGELLTSHLAALDAQLTNRTECT